MRAVHALHIIAVVSISVTSCGPKTPRAAPVRVAAAADLMNAFEELGAVFETQTQQKLEFSFGSSGLLATQLRQGAPFDAFAAANEAFVDNVVSRGVCAGATKAVYGRGRLAVWSRRGKGQPPHNLKDLADARFARIAIAQPEHAPYGQAAAQALQSAGIWNVVQARLVYGENVLQTLQLAATGNVEAAIVALSLVSQDRENPWLVVDEDLHRPLNQTIVACGGGGNASGGRAFARFVLGQAGRAVLNRHGFMLLGDTVP